MREYKLVVLGSGSPGKTALTVQFVDGVFLGQYDITLEDTYQKQVEVDGILCELEILDTADRGIFLSSLLDVYIRNRQGFVLVYSITNKQTFDDLTYFRDQMLKVKDRNDIPMVLVGNQCDLEDERVVSSDQGQNLAKEWGNCSFMESSAKSNINVSEIFFDLVRQIGLKPPDEPEKKKCCCTVL